MLYVGSVYTSTFSFLTFACTRINKICVLGLGFLDYMVVKTLGSFHKLVVSKLEDDACSEVASESA